jgi:hypothetical protein
MEPPALTAESVASQLNRGLASNDTRWAVTCASRVAPIEMGPMASLIDSGLEELYRVGLLDRTASGFQFAQAGGDIAGAWSELISTALLQSEERRPDGVVEVGQYSLLRCTGSIWLVNWTSVSSAGARLELCEINAAAAVMLVRGLLDPLVLPGLFTAPSRAEGAEAHSESGGTHPAAAATIRCPHCGQELPAIAAFCFACGSPAAMAPPQPAKCSNPACGKLIARGVKFCTGCGTPVTAVAQGR